MSKLLVLLLLAFVLFMIIFSTYQLYQGNLEAAFSSLPFLFIVYLYIMKKRPT
jgi:uncharacterized membrane protein YqhA